MAAQARRFRCGYSRQEPGPILRPQQDLRVLQVWKERFEKMQLRSQVEAVGQRRGARALERVALLPVNAQVRCGDRMLIIERCAGQGIVANERSGGAVPDRYDRT